MIRIIFLIDFNLFLLYQTPQNFMTHVWEFQHCNSASIPLLISPILSTQFWIVIFSTSEKNRKYQRRRTNLGISRKTCKSRSHVGTLANLESSWIDHLNAFQTKVWNLDLSQLKDVQIANLFPATDSYLPIGGFSNLTYVAYNQRTLKLNIFWQDLRTK